MKERFKAFAKRDLPIFAVLAVYIFVCNYFGITLCPFKKITGLPCPACGTTRAWVAAFHLDFKAAFHYHPLFPILPPMVLYMFCGKKPLFGSEKRETVITILFFLTILGVWIYKLYRIWQN